MVGQGHRTCGLLVAGLVGLAQGPGFGDGTGARRRQRPIQADRGRSRLVCEDQELRCAAAAPIRRKICCTPARRQGVTMLTLRTLYFEDLSVGMTEPVDEDRGIVRCGRLRRGQRRSQSDPSVGACRRQDAVRHAHRSRPLLSFKNVLVSTRSAGSRPTRRERGPGGRLGTPGSPIGNAGGAAPPFGGSDGKFARSGMGRSVFMT